MTKSFGFREVIFSVNCFIAAMLALWIAFRLDLKNPWWAMVTVYLTSQPLSGVMRARAVYRVVGTLLGAVAMVVIVPNLVDAPELTTAAIILWVAFCLYVSLLDRTPRAYALALSGYTAALVGFPSVLNPGGVFDTAIARMEEIMLGHGMRRAGAQHHFSAQCVVGLAGETERRACRCAALDRRRINSPARPSGRSGAAPDRG